MKFLITKELTHNKFLAILILIFVLFLGIFLLSDLLLHHLQIGLSITQATETLLGNEEEFIEPILFDALLERVHIGIFTSMITLVLLSLVYIRACNVEKSKVIHLAFIFAILAPFSLLLAYAYGELFIPLWIAFFVLWHMLGLYLVTSIVLGILRR